MTDLSRSAADHDLTTLQARVLRRRQLHARSARGAAPFTTTIARHTRRLLAHSRHLPARYVLHLLVGMLVPLAMLASQIPLAPRFETAPATSVPNANLGDLASQVAPLSLSGAPDGDAAAPESAFAAIDALPITSLPRNLLDPQPIAATVVADSANIRGGPGTNYDKIGALPAGTAL